MIFVLVDHTKRGWSYTQPVLTIVWGHIIDIQVHLTIKTNSLCAIKIRWKRLRFTYQWIMTRELLKFSDKRLFKWWAWRFIWSCNWKKSCMNLNWNAFPMAKSKSDIILAASWTLGRWTCHRMERNLHRGVISRQNQYNPGGNWMEPAHTLAMVYLTLNFWLRESLNRTKKIDSRVQKSFVCWDSEVRLW